MNVIARLKYELAYYDSAVHRFNHYTTGTHPVIPFPKFGTFYLVSETFTWYLAPFHKLVTFYMVSDTLTWYLIPFPKFGTFHLVSDTFHLVSDTFSQIWYLLPGIWYLSHITFYLWSFSFFNLFIHCRVLREKKKIRPDGIGFFINRYCMRHIYKSLLVKVNFAQGFKNWKHSW